MAARVVVVMGVSGCGKSTIGKLLSEQLNCDFLEGDSLHPASNIAKMQSGVPLTDDNRMPWLLAINSQIRKHLTAGRRLVVSCSALKPAYRRVLLHGVTDGPSPAGLDVASSQQPPDQGHIAARCCLPPRRRDADVGGQGSGDGPPPPPPAVVFVLLEPSSSELRRRLRDRELAGGHFMPATLLDSQLETLSYDEDELFAHFRGGDRGGDGDGGAVGGDGGSFPGPDSIVHELMLRLP